MKKFLLIILALFAYNFSYAQCTDLFFSEYVEGSGNNKALEIYNPTDHAIDLSGYVVKRYSNGATTPTAGGITNLTGTIEPYHTFVFVNGQTTSTGTSTACDSVLQAMADMLDHEYPAPTYMNGNDAITLEKINGDIVDIIGKVGEDPGEGWYDQASTNYITSDYWLAWTKNHTLIRKPAVEQGVTQNPGSAGAPLYFMVNVEWDSLPNNTWDSLGSHTCDCYSANPMFFDYTSVNVNCYGDSTGSIDITVSGGTEPYSYNWSNGVTTEDINNLVANAYTVTVTDNNSYTLIESIEITEPDSISVNYNYGVNLICYGDSTGSIDLSVSGGTYPYSYIWSNGATTQDINNLAAGTYIVTVTDSNTCNVSKSIDIIEPDSISVFCDYMTNPCYGDSTGSIDLSVSGGTYPYSYIWSNGATTQDINNLAAGIYIVTVTDSNTCNNSNSFEIEEHAKVITDSIEGSQQVIEGELNIYFVTENINSTYKWMVSNGAVISGQTTNLVYVRWDSTETGLISVVETNQYGCSGDTVALEINIGTTGVNNIDKQNFVIVSPNPSNGIFNIKIRNNDYENIVLEIVNINGQCVFYEQFKNINREMVKQINLTDYPKGIYYVKIESDNLIKYKKVIIL